MGSAGTDKRSNGLNAVFLITRSRPGPKLVFHYPASLPRKPWGARCQNDDADASDLESDEEDDNNATSHEQADSYPGLVDDAENAAAELGTSSRSANSEKASDDSILGYSVDSLEKLLSPGRWSDRKKFEVCLNGVTFIGYPVYANQDGSWSMKDTNAVAREDTGGESAGVPTEEEPTDIDQIGPSANITITAPQTLAKSGRDFMHAPESLDSQGGPSLATSMNSASTTSGAVREQLTMFHVVFALTSQTQDQTVDVYQQVLKKFSKSLHYCQKQTSYVAVESRKLLAMRAKAKQTKMRLEALWTQMVESSELAWAMKKVFERISAGEIAGIRLNGMEMSLQVRFNGARSITDDTVVGPHSGLLLLEEKEVLLRELSHPEASPLAYFIREHTPTKSLQKQATKLNMPLNDMTYLAHHLIKWRKAKAIAPLHPSNMYVYHRL